MKLPSFLSRTTCRLCGTRHRQDIFCPTCFEQELEQERREIYTLTAGLRERISDFYLRISIQGQQEKDSAKYHANQSIANDMNIHFPGIVNLIHNQQMQDDQHEN